MTHTFIGNMCSVNRMFAYYIKVQQLKDIFSIYVHKLDQFRNLLRIMNTSSEMNNIIMSGMCYNKDYIDQILLSRMHFFMSQQNSIPQRASII